MRKVILGLAVSLDSFIEGPAGEYDWCFTDQDYGMSEFMKRVDTLVMGRKSFAVAQQYEGGNPWKGMKTYIFSSTLKQAEENMEVISGDVVKQMNVIKNSPGKDIWLFGGADLITQFVNADLIDEYWLSIHPVLLGSGKPLFQNIAGRKNLALKKHKVYSSGLVSLTYEKAYHFSDPENADSQRLE